MAMSLGGGGESIADQPTAQALIFAISGLTRTVQVAQVGFAFTLGVFFIFAGFVINTNSIPSYYAPAKYASFIKVPPSAMFILLCVCVRAHLIFRLCLITRSTASRRWCTTSLWGAW